MSGSWVKFLDSKMLGAPNGIAKLDAQGKIDHNIAAAKIQGEISESLVPELPASKLSGTFAVARIPELAQSKITGLSTALNAKVSNTFKINGIAFKDAINNEITLTKSNIGLDKVENKTGAEIRSELTKDHVKNTGINPGQMTRVLTNLDEVGNRDGEHARYNGKLYVWKETV